MVACASKCHKGCCSLTMCPPLSHLGGTSKLGWIHVVTKVPKHTSNLQRQFWLRLMVLVPFTCVASHSPWNEQMHARERAILTASALVAHRQVQLAWDDWRFKTPINFMPWFLAWRVGWPQSPKTVKEARPLGSLWDAVKNATRSFPKVACAADDCARFLCTSLALAEVGPILLWNPRKQQHAKEIQPTLLAFLFFQHEANSRQSWSFRKASFFGQSTLLHWVPLFLPLFPILLGNRLKASSHVNILPKKCLFAWRKIHPATKSSKISRVQSPKRHQNIIHDPSSPKKRDTRANGLW